MLKKIIFMALIMSQWSMVNSQTISRQVISSAGGTMISGGSMITFNIGETVIPSLSAGGSLITEGFEQPGEQIITGVVSPIICAGGTLNVPFTSVDLLAGNTYTAQLSNAAGSFASPVNIGTLAGNATPGIIPATIPVNTPFGVGYQIRVIGSSPATIGTSSGPTTVNILPLTQTIVGGGAYCAGGSGVSVGLSGSQVGVSYQLKNGAINIGGSVAGTGSAISLAIQQTPGLFTYTVVATNTVTGCMSTFMGNISIGINPLPAIQTVTGGGSNCGGSTTGIALGIANSDIGTTYYFNNRVFAGTGGPISFGIQPTGGSSPILAINGVGCSVTMPGNGFSAPADITIPYSQIDYLRPENVRFLGQYPNATNAAIFGTLLPNGGNGVTPYCSSFTQSFIDVVRDYNDLCTGVTFNGVQRVVKVIERRWTLTDAQGNASTILRQSIYVQAPDLSVAPTVDANNQINVDCNTVAQSGFATVAGTGGSLFRPSIGGATAKTAADADAFGFYATLSNVVESVPTCVNDKTYTRTWLIFRKCSNTQVAQVVQTIVIKVITLPTAFSVSGTVRTEGASIVPNVTVSANVNGATVASANVVNGSFNITTRAANNVQIRATKTNNDDAATGVTTFDIAKISQHVLDIQKLETPYKLIAADVDKSGEIDATDMLHLRRFILKIVPSLPGGNFRFVDKAYAFRNPANPFGEDFPEAVNIAALNANTVANFIAVKLGDVNDSYNGATLRSSKVLTFNTNDFNVVAGNEYTTHISADKMDATAFQGTFSFNSATVKAVKAGNLMNLSDANFGLFKNAVTTSWNGKPQDAADVLTLTFIANKSGKLSDMLTINSALTQVIANDVAGHEMNIVLKFNTGKIAGSEFTLYQNQPNPVSDETTIGFNLPSNSKARLTITTVDGRVVKVVNGEFKAGYNTVSINKSDIQANGIFYYRLETAEHSATKKMVIID